MKLLREYYERCDGGICQDLLTEDEKRRVADVIYRGVVRPRAEYASVVWWHGTPPALREQLEVTQRTIARFIVGTKTKVSNIALLAEAGLRTLGARQEEQSGRPEAAPPAPHGPT